MAAQSQMYLCLLPFTPAEVEAAAKQLLEDIKTARQALFGSIVPVVERRWYHYEHIFHLSLSLEDGLAH